MQFFRDMLSQGREESLEETQQNAFTDDFLVHHKTQPVQQQKDEWKEREQRKKGQ